MGTSAENKLAKRNKILESAYLLFMKNSAASTAIDDVVKMAGVAKGTFYLYFKDKYDLLDQIVAFKSAELLKEAMTDTENIAAGASLNEKVKIISEYIIDYLAGHKDFTALLNKNFSRCFKMFTNGESEEFNDIMNNFINHFVEEGFTEENAKKKIYIITELLGSVCCDSILGTNIFDIDSIRPMLIGSILKIMEVGENG